MGLKFAKPTVTRDRLALKRERDADLRNAVAAVWTRDGHRCVACQRFVTKGAMLTESRGHVHHLVKRSQSKALRAVTSNLCLLCALCHADAHAYRLVISGNANVTLKVERPT